MSPKLYGPTIMSASSCLVVGDASKNDPVHTSTFARVIETLISASAGMGLYITLDSILSLTCIRAKELAEKQQSPSRV